MAIQGQNTSPIMLDQNGRTIDEGYRNMSSGNATVSSAGTRVALANTSTEVKRLDITANLNNADAVTIGGSNVVGALSGRKGVPIFPNNTYTFYVTDLSLIWIDSVNNGDGVSYNFFW